jgi:polysaccharide export outer membrane protein
MDFTATSNYDTKQSIISGLKFFMRMIAWLILFFEISSCTGSRKIVYLYDLKDSSAGSLSKAKSVFETPIQKNDQLSILIGGSNVEDLVALNSSSGIIPGNSVANLPSNLGTPVLGYLVEGDGTIKLPYLDKIKVEGLTRLELENELTEKSKAYTKNPVVNVRFLNYRVSVMGAVNKPGTFAIPNERITILEALGLAGDLSITGKRNNVLVVREYNGVRNFGRVNLLSKEIFNSPYFYLKTNDVIYVEPTPSSFLPRERFPNYMTLMAGSLSVVLTIINIILLSKK